MILNEIAGKVCLVTGASRGIGAAVARGLGARGAKVMVHYRSGRAQAEAVAADIEQQGGIAAHRRGRHRAARRRGAADPGNGRDLRAAGRADQQCRRPDLARRYCRVFPTSSSSAIWRSTCGLCSPHAARPCASFAVRRAAAISSTSAPSRRALAVVKFGRVCRRERRSCRHFHVRSQRKSHPKASG